MCLKISKDRSNGCFAVTFFTQSGFEEEWLVKFCAKEAGSNLYVGGVQTSPGKMDDNIVR